MENYVIRNGVLVRVDDDVKSFIIPEGVTAIGDEAFLECSSLTKITIPDSVTHIYNLAFSGCSSLTEITLSNSLTSISSWAFSDCSSLTKIIIPDSVTHIGNSAFSGCSSLAEITIPDSVKTISNLAFWNCSSLTEITIASKKYEHRIINGKSFIKSEETNANGINISKNTVFNGMESGKIKLGKAIIEINNEINEKAEDLFDIIKNLNSKIDELKEKVPTPANQKVNELK